MTVQIPLAPSCCHICTFYVLLRLFAPFYAAQCYSQHFTIHSSFRTLQMCPVSISPASSDPLRTIPPTQMILEHSPNRYRNLVDMMLGRGKKRAPELLLYITFFLGRRGKIKEAAQWLPLLYDCESLLSLFSNDTEFDSTVDAFVEFNFGFVLTEGFNGLERDVFTIHSDIEFLECSGQVGSGY